METTPKYRIGFMTVLFVIVMIGQYMSTTYIQRDFDEKLQHLLRRTRLFKNIRVTKEIYLLAFFSFLFFILIVRLFFLQVINH